MFFLIKDFIQEIFLSLGFIITWYINFSMKVNVYFQAPNISISIKKELYYKEKKHYHKNYNLIYY